MSTESEAVCDLIPQHELSRVKQRLIDGNGRYINRNLQCVTRQREPKPANQKPYAAIVSCADSRVIPERIFDAGPEHLFVTRVAGNIADTATIASIEFAVQVLGTRVIVVLGHESCGAVNTAKQRTRKPFEHTQSLGYNLDTLIAQIRPAIAALGDSASLKDYTIENARLNAEQLVTRSSIIGNYDIMLLSAYVDSKGRVEFTEELRASDR